MVVTASCVGFSPVMWSVLSIVPSMYSSLLFNFPICVCVCCATLNIKEPLLSMSCLYVFSVMIFVYISPIGGVGGGLYFGRGLVVAPEESRVVVIVVVAMVNGDDGGILVMVTVNTMMVMVTGVVTVSS